MTWASIYAPILPFSSISISLPFYTDQHQQKTLPILPLTIPTPWPTRMYSRSNPFNATYQYSAERHQPFPLLQRLASHPTTYAIIYEHIHTYLLQRTRTCSCSSYFVTFPHFEFTAPSNFSWLHSIIAPIVSSRTKHHAFVWMSNWSYFKQISCFFQPIATFSYSSLSFC